MLKLILTYSCVQRCYNFQFLKSTLKYTNFFSMFKKKTLNTYLNLMTYPGYIIIP